MLDEQRRILTAECSEKVLHHELLAAHAEQDRKILYEELRQQQEFREARQQDLMRHLELQKVQNSESQKTIMDLSGRLQELQNEVNLMNDSKDFMDAESTCSGNPHVTSPSGLFPKHPPFEGMLRPLYSSQRQNEEPPNIWDTSGISGNVFANPQASSSAPYSQELNSSKWNPWRETTEEPIHKSIAEKSGRPKQDSDLRCQSGPSAKNSVPLVEEPLQRIMGQTNNDCRFRIFILTNSLLQLRFRVGSKIQDRGLYLFTISYGSYAVGQRSGVG